MKLFITDHNNEATQGFFDLSAKGSDYLFYFINETEFAKYMVSDDRSITDERLREISIGCLLGHDIVHLYEDLQSGCFDVGR